MRKVYDNVISDKGQGYQNFLEKLGHMIYFRNAMLQWEELSSINFSGPFLPYIDKYSIGHNSGFIACTKNMMTAFTIRQKVELYDFSSNYLKSINTAHKCHNSIPHVLPNNNILIVTDDGHLLVYSNEKLILHFNLCSIISSSSCIVMSASFYKYYGIIILSTGELIDFAFEPNKSGPHQSAKFLSQPKIFAHVNGIERPQSMIFVPSDKSPTDSTLAIIIDQDGALIIASNSSVYKVSFESPVAAIGFSASFSKLAIFQSNKIMMITNPTMSQMIEKYYVFTDDFDDCLSLSWIGDILPIGLFEGGVVLLSEDQLGYWYVDGQPLSLTEIDSSLIITPTKIYRLSVTPPDTACIFVEKESDSKTLCEIFDNRLSEPPFEKLNEINIESAVSGCCAAALFTQDIPMSEFFFGAATYALNSISTIKKGINYEKLRDLISVSLKRSRLLQNLKKLNMPITSLEFQTISYADIVSRLCRMGLFTEAFSISDNIYLIEKSKTEKRNREQEISLSLAQSLIEQNTDDKECLSYLAAQCSRIEFDRVCKLAVELNRPDLARLLADKEVKASRKALCFAEVKEWSDALKYSVYSCDSSILLSVLSQIISFSGNDNSANLLIIPTISSALSFSLRFPNLLADDKLKQILSVIQAGSDSVDSAMRHLINENPNKPNMSVLQPFEALENLQRDAVTAGADSSIVGKSLNETLRVLLGSGFEEQASKIQKACGIEKSKLDILRIQAYATQGKWNQMRKFAGERKKKVFWPFILDLHIQKANNDVKFLLDEIGAIDQKMKNTMLIDLESGKYEVDNLKDRSSIFDIFS